MDDLLCVAGALVAWLLVGLVIAVPLGRYLFKRDALPVRVTVRRGRR